MLTAAALYRCKTDMCMHILHLPVSTPLWMSCHHSHSIKTASKCIQRITHDSITVVDVFTFMRCNCQMNRGNAETKTLIQILYKIQPNNNTKQLSLLMRYASFIKCSNMISQNTQVCGCKRTYQAAASLMLNFNPPSNLSVRIIHYNFNSNYPLKRHTYPARGLCLTILEHVQGK